MQTGGSQLGLKKCNEPKKALIAVTLSEWGKKSHIASLFTKVKKHGDLKRGAKINRTYTVRRIPNQDHILIFSDLEEEHI